MAAMGRNMRTLAILLFLAATAAPAQAGIRDFVAPVLTWRPQAKPVPKIEEGSFRFDSLAGKPAMIYYWIPAVAASVEELRRLDAFVKTNPKLAVRVVAVARSLGDADREEIEKVMRGGIGLPVVLDEQFRIAGELQARFVPAYAGYNKAGQRAIEGFGSLTDKAGNTSLAEIMVLSRDDLPDLALPAPRQVAEGDKAPDFTLTEISGKQIRLYDRLAKGKNVLVVFWSPGCPHCRREVPRIQRFIERNTGLDAVSITRMIGGEDFEAVVAFVESEKIGMPVLADGGRTFAQWGVTGVPFWAVVDPKGTVLTVQSGERQGLEGLLLRYLR